MDREPGDLSDTVQDMGCPDLCQEEVVLVLIVDSAAALEEDIWAGWVAQYLGPVIIIGE